MKPGADQLTVQWSTRQLFVQLVSSRMACLTFLVLRNFGTIIIALKLVYCSIDGFGLDNRAHKICVALLLPRLEGISGSDLYLYFSRTSKSA